MDTTLALSRHLFTGKTAFITGGSSGINLAIAGAYAAHGARVAICGRTQVRLDTAAAQLRTYGGEVRAYQADVRAPEQLAHALQATRDELGTIDILVCGAAGNFLAAAEDLSVNGFRTVVDIDLMGSFHAASLAFEQLRDSKGCILFITAAMASLPHAYQLHVGAAKAGVDNMMRNLALEWGCHGIRANSIMPGPIGDTEGLRRLSAGSALGRLADSVPLRRLGHVQDIAAAAVFLASPMASYITGVVLAVDGGQCLGGSAHFNAGARAFLDEQIRSSERPTPTTTAQAAH
ncbi:MULTISPECIES: SDR family oxidoreductase [unclassified Acidovorax]|uniref:SDR family oxidoreductase n=1 Tax=unclassified Acidovorax TaxID=2684926 RepID=UPI001C4693C2|nr:MULTISPECIES: SDR family oxidoreductase [unclassified Acidovorax]MBV7460290.1 SDR family oxidoreductase [Acidovorax sp. sif0632]MBV7465315.1 SDR family oxidoreductase [Acidovorax sp. sif0613]